MMGCDVVKANTLTFWLKIISLILFVIIVLVSICKMFIHLMMSVIKGLKKKVKQEESRIAHMIYIALTGMNCITGVLFYRLIIMPLNGGSVKHISVLIQCVILGLIAIITIICTAVMMKQLKDYKTGKRTKRRYVLMMVMSCYISWFIWYWQLYNFWSC